MPRATADPVIRVEHLDGVYEVAVRQPTVVQYRDEFLPHIRKVEDSAAEDVDQLISGVVDVLRLSVIGIDCVPSVEDLTMGEALAIYRAVASFITGGTSGPGSAPQSSSPSSSESPQQEPPISQPT